MGNMRRVVEMIATCGGIGIDSLNVEDLCNRAMQMLISDDETVNISSEKSDDGVNNFIPGVASCCDVMKGRAANAATASSSLVLQTKIENQKPFSTNNSHTDVYTTSNRKPLATIPPSLSEQIQNKLSGKFQLKSVFGNEMMNAKHIARRSPEKVDNMQAAL